MNLVEYERHVAGDTMTDNMACDGAWFEYIANM